MQGPRTKEAEELEWSRIKRAITARVNYDAQCWREAELNSRLEKAWDEFKDALANGLLVLHEPPELGSGS
jgi:hypothetical protein